MKSCTTQSSEFQHYNPYMITTKLKYRNFAFWISKDLKQSLRGSSIPLGTPRFSTSFETSRVWRTAYGRGRMPVVTRPRVFDSPVVNKSGMEYVGIGSLDFGQEGNDFTNIL